MHIFLKKKAVPIIIFCEWMPHWMPLKKPTRWVSEGCPLSTEWEVIERGVALEREGGFEGCPRAVSLRLKPPLAAKSLIMSYCINFYLNWNVWMYFDVLWIQWAWIKEMENHYEIL